MPYKDKTILKKYDKERQKKSRIKNPKRFRIAEKKYKDSHKEDRRRREYLRKYKITIENYNNILVKQNHRCAICGKDEVDNGKYLAVDHNHKTGKVRGLLCNQCNSGLGFYKDDINILLKAVIYLEEFH